MQTKTCNTILALGFALLAMLASALPVAAQSSHYLRMENNTGYDVYSGRRAKSAIENGSQKPPPHEDGGHCSSRAEESTRA